MTKTPTTRTTGARAKPSTTRSRTTRKTATTPPKKTRAPAKSAKPVATAQDSAAESLTDIIAQEAQALVAQEDIDDSASGARLGVMGVTRPLDTVAQDTTNEAAADDASAEGKLAKKDLIDRVIARAGVKPRHVRQVAEALLAEMGTMLDEAETLQVQPLGTLKVQRRKNVGDGAVIICKLKRKKSTPEGNDPLATAAE
ncbi:HU family DNA-binding protein [Maritimibacter sp. DP1N21-5]|uniref:HU family DNA-binding protein n=1 Tax=Maritimibacter sp. DP1N21-5 TaxID=2836867 RepID=UPI001C4815A1|nr:HU family DNA-binding protein [Maritimibacter sp. DP1N21-5]MBV7409733.1 HU family DNA-binding protein [Maritimibacter sp. DP1N21-5]